MNGYNMNVSFLHENVFFSAELPENWTDTRETILEGMTFNLRHLGMTLVDQPKGEDLSAAAVKRIVAMVRTGIKSRLLYASQNVAVIQSAGLSFSYSLYLI